MILDIQQEISPELIDETGYPNSRSVNVLSAAYILQDYLAGKIAAIGESSEGEDIDHITWEGIKGALKYYEGNFRLE